MKSINQLSPEERQNRLQILTLYVGCKCMATEIYPHDGMEDNIMQYVIGGSNGIFILITDENHIEHYKYEPTDVKPILRSISDMTVEESQELAWLIMDTDKLEDRITKDELHVQIIKCKDDVSIRIDVDCRCFEGTISIHKNGDIFLHDEDMKDLPLDNQAQKFQWLISKQFDLFNWIENGLATKVKNKIPDPLSNF